MPDLLRILRGPVIRHARDVVKLRSVELILPEARKAIGFLTDVCGLTHAEVQGAVSYLRGSSAMAYLISLKEGEPSSLRSTTFTCTDAELRAVSRRAAIAGWPVTPTDSSDPGGGHGILVELPGGELFRVLAGAADKRPLTDLDVPMRLTHVLIHSQDAQTTAEAAESVLGLRVADRRQMVFVHELNCADALTRAGLGSLSHIAFQMRDLDALMRGIARLRAHGFAPVRGPDRRDQGANAFACFVAPFGMVVEFSALMDTRQPATS
jgi:2,3-dihydroxy-p-cumate/2,3-dihydroxybenzoate 3,4-dioxygenase